MPLALVQINESFATWINKTNAMITQVNTLGNSSSVISTTSPTTGQFLMFDGNFFRNVTLSGDVTFHNDGSVTVNPGVIAGVPKGRLFFAGATRSTY